MNTKTTTPERTLPIVTVLKKSPHRRDRAICTARLFLQPGTVYQEERDCRREGQFMVDGKPMCAIHAGKYCLEYLVLEDSGLLKRMREVK